MRLTLSFLVLLFFSAPVFAQNWQTVNPSDTVYFKATLPDPCPACGNPLYGTLRVTWVDSVTVNPGNKVFHFYRSARANGVACADTAAASWMGYFAVRQTDGVEYYFNSLNDTTRFNTAANVGDNWIIGTDTSGNVFHATVTGADTATIDGALDSVKTINLQAFNGSNAVTTFYDTIPVKWSKNHGWINSLDWYVFPYTKSSPDWMGMLLPNSFERVPAAFKAKDYKHIDLAWKYAPGNEWTYVYDSLDMTSGVAVSNGYHDSIISSNLINPYKIAVTRKRSALDTALFTVFSDTVTVDSTLLSVPVRNFVYPEYKRYNMQDMNTGGAFGQSKDYHYRLLPFCDDRDFFYDKNSTFMGAIPSGSCWQVGPSISGFATHEYGYLDGFGQTSYLHTQYWPNFSTSWEYSYIKIGSCTLGSYVPAGVDDPNLRKSNPISVAPNPATDIVYISIPERSIQLAIYDATGRIIRNETLSAGTNTLSIGGMPTGLYLLRFSGPSTSYTYKLVKN